MRLLAHTKGGCMAKYCRKPPRRRPAISADTMPAVKRGPVRSLTYKTGPPLRIIYKWITYLILLCDPKLS